MDNFISIHIPKTGGTVFLRYILRDIWPHSVHQDYDSKDKAYGVQSVWKVIHGHFKPSKYEFLGWPMIFWVRHPLKRALSEYGFLKRREKQRGVFCEFKSFKEFMESNINAISEAIEHKPINAFPFVGVLEYFNESMKNFGEFAGINTSKYRDKDFIDRVTSQYHENKFDYEYLTNEEVDKFNELNELDYKLYFESIEKLTNETS